MAGSFTYDLFLSHNSRDKAKVRTLAKRLRDAGLKVWFDEWVIKTGDDIYLAIERGLEAARVQVLCLSPEALSSDWVTLERNTVLFRDPTNAGRRFVPLLMVDCQLPDTLRRYKYVDFRRETEEAFDELVAACRSEEFAAPDVLPSKSSTEPEMAKSEPAPPRPMPVKVKPKQGLFTLEREFKGYKTWTTRLAVSPDGEWVASLAYDKTIRTWDLNTGERRATLSGHLDEVQCVVITADGKRIVSGSNDQSIRVWDAIGGKELAKLAGFRGTVHALALYGNDNIVSGGGHGGNRLRFWNLATCKCVAEGQTADIGAIWGLAANRDGTGVISANDDGSLRVWDTGTHAKSAELTGHRRRVLSVQVTPDGRHAVSGSADATVKIWDLETKTCVATLEGHKGTIYSVALSPDCTLIASAGFADCSVRIWDWKTGACLQAITLVHPMRPVSVAFSPDGLRLLVGTADENVPIHVYRLTGSRTAPPAEATRRYVNAKVVLLGEGTVGKTSLAHRLIDDKYVVMDRTHGMNVWPLPLPLLPDATIDREALLWDLAGQEDYRLIHRLFLDETALALLLINPQKDDPLAEAGDWLKALDTAAGNHESKREAARLLVYSQIDVGGMKLGNAKIERFIKEQRFTDWLATSAKTGENCSDRANGGKPSKLKQLIAESIPWDKLPWTATPKLLVELKAAILKMRDTTDIRLLRFSELAQRLEQALPDERFDESDVRTAVTLLWNHGLARPLRFGDLVLLQPELLNGYAGAIIRAARSHKDEIGCVLEADIYGPHFDFTGVNRLPRPDEELLLRAMVQMLVDRSLCIAEETPHGRQLVFPSQYRRDKDIPREPDIFVSYTFGGEWQTIWTTLVVRLWHSQEFEHKELWRNAVEFKSSRGHLLGLKIDNRQGEGEATIRLFFDVKTPDELKVIFIEYVHLHLAKYGCDVKRDRRYVCTACSKPVTDVAVVRKRLAAGKDFVTCQDCDERVPLIDFIEQRLKSDPVARTILAMEEAATRELDTQALEQILIGHMLATCGEANQIFRPVSIFDYGIDGEVEFKDNQGRAGGKKIYVQLKSGKSYLRTRRSDGREVFDVKNERHLEYWLNQPVDVYLVIRQTGEETGAERIRWMNVSRYLREREDKESRQIVFEGEPLTMEAVWRKRDEFFPTGRSSGA
jgi:WD40 repeat protein